MSDQSKLNLGKIITTEQNRDAIHIAVAPVVAAHTLIAGRHVGLDQHGQASEHTDTQIGIVDPYLRVTVEKGQEFWLFLYPGSITSLRHEWAHPAFEHSDEDEKWIREYAKSFNHYDDAETAYNDLVDGLKSGHLCRHGSDMYGLHDLDDSQKLKEVAERHLGIAIDWEEFTFSCGC